MKFRKKPVVIEAIQWDGTAVGIDAIKAAFGDLDTVSRSGFTAGHPRENEVTDWRIRTPEGAMRVSPGDWVIQGVKGELYPCKPDIFAATYEQVNE